ncbi:MAG: UDP-N-acetylmuramate dehydrogenase [Actinomycetota bacterium]
MHDAVADRHPSGLDAAVIERAVDRIGDIAVADAPLAPLTTYKVGGSAAVFAEVTSVDDLLRVGRVAREFELPLLPIGRGSNLLVADAGFPGIALITTFDDIEIDTGTSSVRAGSAVPLPVLARRTAQAGLTGFEWAVGVPGSIGGAVRMNAGGHGSDMAASLVDVDLLDLDDADDPLHLLTVPADALGLRFRGSDLHQHVVVVSARLQLAPADSASLEKSPDDEIKEIVRWRLDNQPGGQNAGSVFVNPVPGEVSAGELVDRAGQRGRRHGTAEVSEKHANFIQADPGGSADDVYELMRLVRAEVLAATGYALRSEIRLVGFPDGWGDPT